MITPQRARAFREGQKNDKNDAEAIAHAIMNRQTRFVAPKTVKQQKLSSINAMRNLHIRQRTQTINHMRATFKEYGIPYKKGASSFENNIEDILQEETKKKSLPVEVIQGLLAQIAVLKCYKDTIKQLEKKILILSEEEECKRLKTVPGVGSVVSTMLSGHGGDVAHYETSKDFAASLGLVPRQYSTGGKQVYGRISKRGMSLSLRANLIHGARSVLAAANKKRKTGESSGNTLIDWGLSCYDRMGMNRPSVALANKIARISWKILKTPGEVFMPSIPQAV